jgi:hypothetical protein
MELVITQKSLWNCLAPSKKRERPQIKEEQSEDTSKFSRVEVQKRQKINANAVFVNEQFHSILIMIIIAYGCVHELNNTQPRKGDSIVILFYLSTLSPCTLTHKHTHL